MTNERPVANSGDARSSIEAKLTEVGLAATRCISIASGKASHDHDTRTTPTERSGVNYGVYATENDMLVVLDIDDYKQADGFNAGIAALNALPDTLEVGSPHGGKHRYYRVTPYDGMLPAGLFNAELGTKNPIASWGETVVSNKYVVGPGSVINSCTKDWHDCSEESEGEYTITNHTGIASVSGKDMLAALLADENVTQATHHTPPESSDPTDVEVDDDRLQTALEKDDELRRLYHGRYMGEDRSENEARLAAKLAFWIGGEHNTVSSRQAAVRNAMDSSDALKWHDRDDDSYRDSILGVVAKVDEFYTPGEYSGKQSVNPSLDAAKDARADGGLRPAVEDIIGHELVEVDPADSPVSQPSIEDRIQQEVLLPYSPPEDLEGEVDGISKETAIDRIARIFDDEWEFIHPRVDVQGWPATLHYYDPEFGIYLRHGEAHVKKEAERLLGDFAQNRIINELVRKLERRNAIEPRKMDDPHPGRIVVGNGILDLRTGELDSYTPGEYHRTRIDVNYDPDAECPEIDSFLHDIVESGDVPTLYRLVAHTLYQEYAEEKALMLVGDGQNGKSVFLSLIREFLGEMNVAGRSLQELAEKQFAENNLHGKLANLHPDMSDEKVSDISKFKQLTGNDVITADVKYEKPVNFRNYATMIFAANGVPQLPEDNRAVWRRWVYVSFPNTFKGDDQIPKRVLMRNLTTEEELQGLLARCVEEVQEWWQGREWFADSPGPEQTREMLKRAAEPVYDFATACLVDADPDEEDAILLKEQVREAYKAYARDEGLPMIPGETLGDKLTNMADYEIESTRSRILTSGSSRDQVYRGVKLSPRGEQVLGIYDDDEHGDLDPDDDELDGNPHTPEEEAEHYDGINEESSTSSESDNSSDGIDGADDETEAETGDENGPTADYNADGLAKTLAGEDEDDPDTDTSDVSPLAELKPENVQSIALSLTNGVSEDAIIRDMPVLEETEQDRAIVAAIAADVDQFVELE